jgi:hypothetical protein
MAPSKSLLKTLKFKSQPVLTLDAPLVVNNEKLNIFSFPKTCVPEPTREELTRWVKARELQKTDEEGNPVEGWVTRIETMKNDGRLWYSNDDKRWHRR